MKEPLGVLSKIVKKAYESPYSRMYRDIYERAGFTPGEHLSSAAWRSTPFIGKEDLASRPYYERAFLPIEEARFIHTSSGTTKSPVVLNLRNKLWKAYNHKPFADRMLFFRGGGFLHYVYRAEGIASVCGDMRDFETTARIASRFKVDGIMTTSAHLCALTPHLEREMDVRGIRLFVSSGDRFSSASYAFIRTHYPNAVIRNTYGTAETGGLHAQSCAEIEATGKNFVHFSEEDIFPELVNERGEVVEDEGEMVLTLLWEGTMLPIIRFRTGDIARRVDPVCGCGADTYELLGRAGFDFVRIPGGLVKADEVEKAVASALKELVEDDYELHIIDSGQNALSVRAELLIRPREGVAVDFERAARDVERALLVGPGETYGQGVLSGKYEPLVCRELPQRVAPAKYMRVVRRQA